MEKHKAELNNLREMYDKSTNHIIRRELRVKIYELEKNNRNLCIKHGGTLVFDEYGDLFGYSEIDEYNNCKICGVSVPFMSSK